MSRAATHRERAVPSLAVPALLGVLAFSMLLGSCSDGPSEEELRSAECLAGAGELFERRIRPLLEADRPKTCNQCHLSGVDLGLFVRDTMCETRACLITEGLVDPNDVGQSLILSWIARATPSSELITEQVIAEEYEGFRAFLTELVSCSGASCRGVSCGAGSAGGECERQDEPTDVTPTAATIGCEPLAIEQAFRDNVFSWRGRCFPCHFEEQTKSAPTAPRWLSVAGGCDAASVAALRNVIDSGYLDAGAPEQSLLLLKPLSESAGGVEHGGGDKFHDATDPAYVSFLSFIEHWATCVNAGQPY